jgi:dynein heavy chain
MVHYRSWCKSIEAIKSGLNSTILVKDPETHELMVNFDPQVWELMKEASYIKRMNLAVPESAESIFLMADELNSIIVEYVNKIIFYQSLLKPFYF